MHKNFLLCGFGRTLDPLKNQSYLGNQPLTHFVHGASKIVPFTGAPSGNAARGCGVIQRCHIEQRSRQFLENIWEWAFKFWSYSDTTRMWANAQCDGRPVEYRWRPLFNAAKFGWRPVLKCRAVTLPRRETRWNLQGCPNLANRSQPLVHRSSPYYEDM